MNIAPNDDKFKQLILYIAEKSEGDRKFGATKLNKLLFFSDFVAYRVFGEPITGQVYFKLDHGPAPRRLKPIKAQMESAGLCVEKTREYYGRKQNVLVALEGPDLSQFSGAQIALVDQIIEDFWHFNAREISCASHGFIGWELAKDQEEIPYEMSLVEFAEPTGEEVVVSDELNAELAELEQECIRKAG